MAVTAQTESNNTENVFWVLGRVPRLTFDMNMKSCILAHFGVISLVYMFMCMFISYKARNRCTREIFLKGSDFDVYTLGYYEIYLSSCILNCHKLRQSQIATIQESLPSQFVICRNLWSRPWRHKLSQITLQMCFAYLGEYPWSLLTGICEIEFWPFPYYLLYVLCIIHQRCINKMKEQNIYRNWVNICHSIAYFDVVTNCDTFRHKLRHPSQIATLSVTNCDTVTNCDDHKLLRNKVLSSNAFTIWCCIPISRPPKVFRRFKRRTCLSRG